MTRPLLLPLFFVACLILPSATAPAPSNQDAIEGRMRSIKKILAELKENVDNKELQEANLKSIDQLLQDFIACKNAPLPKAEELEGKKKDSMILEYKKLQLSVLHDILDLEEAVLEGNGKKAKKLVSSITASEGKGHGKFKE